VRSGLFPDHADGNGNVTYLVNSSQTLAARYRYDAYGNLLSYWENFYNLGTANTYRFSSKRLDLKSSLYCYCYRWYVPNVQRWLNRDPFGENGFEAVRSPGRSIKGIASNQYYFIANDPVDNIDALGLKLYKSVRQARTMADNLHAYLWDNRNQKSCGRTGSGWSKKKPAHGEDAGDKGPSDPNSGCVEIPNSDGKEDSVMNCCMRTDPNRKWFPFTKDCHNWVDVCQNRQWIGRPRTAKVQRCLLGEIR